ncbi:MAG: restriction endonuclease subunit S [Clostridia bacterium]|nr:restriction endonuclease subunit S [Clostridia bacterium]
MMEKTVKDVVKESFWIMPATPNFIDNGIPYITSKNIKMGKLDFSKVQYISQNDYDEISKNRPIIVNDLLISMIGTLGNVAIVKECDIPFYGQNMFLLRLNPDIVDLRYFYNYFNSDTINSYLQSKKNKSTQGYLKANHIDDLRIPIVSLEEQKRIADELDKITDLINKRKEQLSKMDELVKARFVELFGDPKYNKNNLVKIGEIGALTSGGTPSRAKPEYFEGDIRWYSAGELNSLYLPDSVEHISETALQQSSAKLFNKGTLMIGMYDTAAFKMGILTEDSSSNQACANLNPKQGYNIVWLYYLFDIMKPIFLQERRGVRQKNLSLSKIKEFEVPFAPFELQNQFATFVEQTDKSKLEVQKSLEKLELLKKALMQKYFG